LHFVARWQFVAKCLGKYTFFSHLKWTPMVLPGYAAGILVNMWIDADTFNIPLTAG